MERLEEGEARTEGPELHRLLEESWQSKGVLSSSKKRVLCALKAQVRKKWVQVVAGWWVHLLSFRRPGMIFFDGVWKFVSSEERTRLEMKARSELFGVCMAAVLFRTNLRASLSSVTTASDASSSGGAVGRSVSPTSAGMSFACADRGGKSGGQEVPVLVLSLFNGIGCCFRCYDLCGISPRYFC